METACLESRECIGEGRGAVLWKTASILAICASISPSRQSMNASKSAHSSRCSSMQRLTSFTKGIAS